MENHSDVNLPETDPVFTIWDRSSGILITESQITDFGNYLETELDGDSTNEIQTIDIAQLNGTSLELSLSSDGEVTKLIDLSALQDGIGTDDQTASEINVDDVAGNFVSTNVEDALAELASNNNGTSLWQDLGGAIAPVVSANEIRIGGTGDMGSYIIQITGDGRIVGSLVATGNLYGNSVDITNLVQANRFFSESYYEFKEQLYVSTPGNGNGRLFFKDDGNLYALNDTGTETNLTSGSGGETNVQSNWNETDSGSDAFILNKPTIPSGNQVIDWTQSGQGIIDPSNYVDNDTQLNELDVDAFVANNGYLTTETDGLINNEGNLTVGVGTATTSVIQSNTSGSTDVTLQAGNNISLTETGNIITISGTGTPNYSVQTLSGTAVTLNGDNAVNSTITLTANTTITLSNLVAGQTGNLTVTNAATVYTITLAGYNILIAPYLTFTGDEISMSGNSLVDVLSWYYDGTNVIINGTLGYQ